MSTEDASRILSELESSETPGYLEKVAGTYRLLRLLRALIDESDTSLNQLASSRDDGLYLLGQDALTELNSKDPTLEQADFAENIEAVRTHLDRLRVDASEAREKHHDIAAALTQDEQRLSKERRSIEAKIEDLEQSLFEIPEEALDREERLGNIAEAMVELKGRRDEISSRQREHSLTAEAALNHLTTHVEMSQDAVTHMDARLKAVVRDLGRSVLTLDHELSRSDLARSVEEALAKMSEVRAERHKAVKMLDRVDTTPIVQFLAGLLIVASTVITGLFWLT